MTRPPIWSRIYGRFRRGLAARRHARFDEALLERAAGELSVQEVDRLARELTGRAPASAPADAGGGGSLPASAPAHVAGRGLLPRRPRDARAAWREQVPAAAGAVAEADEPLAGQITLFGVSIPLAEPSAWHHDLSGALRNATVHEARRAVTQRDSRGWGDWPLLSHHRVPLTPPRAPGDARIQWEPARFHHGLLLGRAYLASGDPAYAAAFKRQVEAFMAGNPPYRGIHWTVGMEVAIRAAAWAFTLEFFRGAPPMTAEWGASMVRHLLLHGLYLETHIERHPLGVTTNHTVADYAGLAVLGRVFAGTACGERWRASAASGLSACLVDQVLAGGAHAEAALPYERFVLEACLVAAQCIDPGQAGALRPGIHALARHLRAVTLEAGLPFVGDGDDSFFPPFACRPFSLWDPTDPEAVLQAAAGWCGDPALRRRAPLEEAAFWLGAPAEFVERAAGGKASRSAATPISGKSAARAHRSREPMDASSRARSSRKPMDGSSRPAPLRESMNGSSVLLEDGIRFTAGPFTGLLLARDARARWLPTHGHNDLLSLLLELDGMPLLIDPGTGAYGLDPAIRHALRSTAAHSTLQLAGREQSPIDPARPFEGPPPVPGGRFISGPAPTGKEPQGGKPQLLAEAWHDGFGLEFRHLRRIYHAADCLWIEDLLGPGPDRNTAEGAAGAKGRSGGGRIPERRVPAPQKGASRAGGGGEHESALRFRLTPGLALRGVEPWQRVPGLEGPPGLGAPGEASDSQEPVSASRVVLETRRTKAEFLLLRPRKALWQIGSENYSRRYGVWQEAPVLHAHWKGPLPHRWLVGIRCSPGARAGPQEESAGA